MQNRLEFTIKDYRELAKIEIEIITFKYEYGPFFNFNKELSSFYHEYCDDCKEEKLYKRLHFFDEDSNLKKITLIIDCEIKSLKGLFKNRKNIEKINFIKFNRNDINDMSEMFYNCSTKG